MCILCLPNISLLLLCLCVEFEEAAELLSADPGASTLSLPAAAAAGEEVKLDLSEDEDTQQESSEVRKASPSHEQYLEFLAPQTCLCL